MGWPYLTGSFRFSITARVTLSIKYPKKYPRGRWHLPSLISKHTISQMVVVPARSF